MTISSYIISSSIFLNGKLSTLTRNKGKMRNALATIGTISTIITYIDLLLYFILALILPIECAIRTGSLTYLCWLSNMALSDSSSHA